MGVPIPAINCMRDLWTNATHTIKTKYGYSMMTYKNPEEVPLYGPGQGSTTGPNLWGILFNIIAKNIPDDFPAITFTAVDHSDTVTHKGDAFVDDSQLGCTAKYGGIGDIMANSVHQIQRAAIVQDIQKLAQRWEKLLFMTRGALNLQKSFWLLMLWKWKKGRASLITVLDDPSKLTLSSGYDVTPV